MTTRFRLNRSGLLLALISSAFAGQVQAAAAGRVEFAIGGATLSGPNGQQRALSRGTEVNSGDVVRTTDGRVQVRMADGAYISLQPNTEFGIKDYKFEGKADGTESAFYSLLKGAMRTVTGLIGRINRNRYQVSTPTATVGIRGTGGLIQVRDDGSTLVQGTSGIWFLANPAGSIDVPAGVSGVAPSDPNQPPQETGEAPTAGPAPLPPEQEYVQGNQTEENGTTVITGNVLVSGSGYSAAVSWGGLGVDQVVDGVAVFNSAGQMTSITANQFFAFILDNGSHANFGTDGILAWGRWIGDATVPTDGLQQLNFNANQGVHYVVGLPTPALPTSGTATYSLLGATQPTFVDGLDSPGTFSFATGGGLTVRFAAGSATLSLAGAQVSMPGWGTYEMNGGTTICGSSSSFSFSPTVTGSGSACSCFCSSSVQGFFAGATAERAGIGYSIGDSGLQTSRQVVGAAALKQ